MIKEIIGIILIFVGVYSFLRNRENIFRSFNIDFFNVNKLITFFSLLLIVVGIILILW